MTKYYPYAFFTRISIIKCLIYKFEYVAGQTKNIAR